MGRPNDVMDKEDVSMGISGLVRENERDERVQCVGNVTPESTGAMEYGFDVGGSMKTN